MAVENAEKIIVDKCFISASGFTETEILNAGMVGTQVKKAMIRNSRKTFLLADSTKYSGSGVIKVCKWEDVDAFICDALLPDNLKYRFENLVAETYFVEV